MSACVAVRFGYCPITWSLSFGTRVRLCVYVYCKTSAATLPWFKIFDSAWHRVTAAAPKLVVAVPNPVNGFPERVVFFWGGGVDQIGMFR